MSGTQNKLIVRLSNDRPVLLVPGETEVRALDVAANLEWLITAVEAGRAQLVFAAPATSVRIQQLTVSAAERKHLAKSLPFLLEEQLADDVEDLHFAMSPLDKLNYAVAHCKHADMEHWQSTLADLSAAERWVAEPLLLPLQAGGWTIVIEDESALVRFDACEGTGLETSLLSVLLDSALATMGAPQSVVLYGFDQAADTQLLPASLRSAVQWRRGGLAASMMIADTGLPEPNLLQGEYAPRLPLARWWLDWRAVAAVLAGVFLLQLVATFADYQSLKNENLALRTAVEQSYRSAYPRGAMVDPEKQLRRQLSTMRGGAQSSGFMVLMETVGAVIHAQSGTSIASINYNDNGGDMRLNIVAEDFEAVEKIRAGINAAGLEAVMESSSAQSDGVRARLRVEADS
ncbi:MAG: type II secretion system protein GspL [Halioglobus sp.]